MNKFIKIKGRAAPLFKANIDTDQIIPKQFLTRIERTGYGAFLFNDWRFNSDGSQNADFVLNDRRYFGAPILIAGANFGCGSSREHAAWSLLDYGISAVIAPSFGDIFFNNSLKNGLLPIRLTQKSVELMVERTVTIDSYKVTVDLVGQTVTDSHGLSLAFEIDEFQRFRLINGLDDIDLTLLNDGKIMDYEKKARNVSPHLGIDLQNKKGLR